MKSSKFSTLNRSIVDASVINRIVVLEKKGTIQHEISHVVLIITVGGSFSKQLNHISVMRHLKAIDMDCSSWKRSLQAYGRRMSATFSPDRQYWHQF